MAVGGLLNWWYMQYHQEETTIIVIASGLILEEGILSMVSLGLARACRIYNKIMIVRKLFVREFDSCVGTVLSRPG